MSTSAHEEAYRNDTLGAQQPHESDESEDSRNPLWIVAFGMACMFGMFAAVLALG